MNVFLSDDEVSANLFPITETRSAADIRVGILTIKEKWETCLGAGVQIMKAGERPAEGLVFSSNIIPSKTFVQSLLDSKNGHADPDWESVKLVQFPWHIFMWNDWAIRQDFDLLTANRRSAPIPNGVAVTSPENIFIEEGAKLSHCILNAETGPIYIGRNATMMEGALIRGPFALCEGATVKMGSKIYGATTIGPYSVVGGEIKNSVILGYSNKAHDGYLGDSVIGEWCNLGAGTSNSNMKNNAGDVRIWNNGTKEMKTAGLSKCGLIMGDYSRASINTSFNTGTVVGICANVFGEGLSPKFIPSFTWGSKGLSKYEFEKALVDIENWKKLKGRSLDENEKMRLKLIFEKN